MPSSAIASDVGKHKDMKGKFGKPLGSLSSNKDVFLWEAWGGIACISVNNHTLNGLYYYIDMLLLSLPAPLVFSRLLVQVPLI